MTVETLRIPAWKITHPGGILYTFIMNSDTLLSIAYVSADERENGVQRPLSEKRIKDVGKFIDSEDGVFANNIILNLPPECVFEEQGDNNHGYINIPMKEKSAWVVDGQHRLFGFQEARNNYELLCSAFIGLDVKRQAEIFITINTQQKGIPASVIYDLLPIVKDAEFKKTRSQSLVKQFNEDPESPFYNEIKMLGVGKGLVSQATFAKNIEKLINPNGGVLAPYTESVQYKILNNYFGAFKAIFNEEWGSNKYVLTKTVGIAAMCGVFPKVHELCKRNFKKENILTILNNARGFDFSSTSLGKGTNNVAIQNVINDLMSKLPEIDLSDSIQL